MKFKDRGFQILAVDRMRDTGKATKFIREKSLPFRFIEDGNGKEEFVVNLVGIHSFPTCYLIDRAGRILRVHVGFDEGDEKEYEKQIIELLDADRPS